MASSKCRAQWTSTACVILLFCTTLSWAEDIEYLHGKFVRADLLTDDLAASQKFYGKLFGWTFESSKDHVVAYVQERRVGTLVQHPRPENSNAKPRWIAYMSVADVGAVRQKVIEAGGAVLLEPHDLRDLGMAGIFSDPEGALFGAVHNKQGDPEDVIADMGSWIWIELFSRDASRAGDFYATIGGYEVWDYEPQSKALQDRTNLMLASDGYARAAITEFAKERSHTKAVWLPFVRVADTALAIRRAQELGGQVLVAPNPDIFNGKAAVLTDSRGAAIGIMEWAEDDSAVEDGK